MLNKKYTVDASGGIRSKVKAGGLCFEEPVRPRFGSRNELVSRPNLIELAKLEQGRDRLRRGNGNKSLILPNQRYPNTCHGNLKPLTHELVEVKVLERGTYVMSRAPAGILAGSEDAAGRTTVGLIPTRCGLSVLPS